MLVKLVGANGLNEIFDGLLDFVVLGLELLTLGCNPFTLHLDEFIKSVGGRLLGQVHENCLGERLEVVLNTVLHDVIDIDDELLKLGKTCMYVGQVAIDVH